MHSFFGGVGGAYTWHLPIVCELSASYPSSFRARVMAALSLRPQCCTWHSVLKQSFLGKQERLPGQMTFEPLSKEMGPSLGMAREWVVLQARETSVKACALLAVDSPEVTGTKFNWEESTETPVELSDTL